MTVPLSQAALNSARVVQAGAELSVEAARIVAGRSKVVPAKGDGRFADPEWNFHPGYRRLKQLYLAWSNAVDGLVESADLEWRTRERARFAAGILTSAAAPTNTLAGNPAAIKLAVQTRGASLVSGARHLCEAGGMANATVIERA